MDKWDGQGGSARAWLGGESLMGGMASRPGGSKPLGCHVFQKSGAPWMKFAIKATLWLNNAWLTHMFTIGTKFFLKKLQTKYLNGTVVFFSAQNNAREHEVFILMFFFNLLH